MSAAAPFSWLDTQGWLILSGRRDSLSEIRARALSRYLGGGAMAYVSLRGDLGDALMDDMAELGAPSGYLVDLEEADNNEIYERLSGAGMIVIEADCRAAQLKGLMSQTATSAMKAALERGALILFEGAAAAIVGERALSADGEIIAGINFVHKTLILPSGKDGAESEKLRSIHHRLPGVSLIHLECGAALALGPARQLETWGDGEVRISLGELACARDRSGALQGRAIRTSADAT